jgi:hypothetical protein
MNTKIVKLTRKFLVLGILLAGLALATSDLGSRQALARPCCSDCEAQEQDCYQLDPYWQPMCLNSVWQHCWRWCSFGC